MNTQTPVMFGQRSRTAICLLVLLQLCVSVVESSGNSLVSCMACQAVHVRDWTCDVNCYVTKGSGGDIATGSVISELMQKIDQLNETLTERIDKLKGSRCAFAALGSGSDTETTINSSPIVFDNVDLNVCNGYDVATGIFTAPVAGTYMLSTHIQARGVNNGPLKLRKNDDSICELWLGQDGSWDLISCSTVTHLDLGDNVKVTGDAGDPANIVYGVRNGFSGILVHADD